MTTAAVRVCSKPGCSHLVGNGRTCPVHPPRPPFAGRPTYRQRGYTYAWDKRARELKAAGTMCGYCGLEPMAELDHRIPVSQGGTHDADANGVPACARCHRKKTGRESAAARVGRRP